MRIGHDVETYINYFCVGIENYVNNEKILFEISEVQNDISKIISFYSNLKTEVVSFNGIFYDNLMLQFILKNQVMLLKQPWYVVTSEIKRFSDKVIEGTDYNSISEVRRYKKTWTDIDLFLYWSKDLRLSKKISLKSLGIQLGYPVVQELPYTPSSVLTLNQLPLLREYNLVHDLGILRKLHDNMSGDIDLRTYIQDTLKISCLSMDAPKIASEILLYDYCNNHKYDVNVVRKWNFQRNTIPLNMVLEGFDPKFKTTQFKEMFNRWKQSYDSISETFVYRQGLTNVALSYGIGGLHSVNENEQYYSNDTHIVMTSDVASLYPNLIINYKCIRFIEVLEKYANVMVERLIAKKNKEKTKDKLFKLILNSISGMLDNQYSWLYFPEGALRMRLIGQLILSKFIEECALNNWQVVSANTDGIEVIIPKEDKDKYITVLDEAVKAFDMSLEHEQYEFIVYKNVNNYIAKVDNGDIKQKGLFVEKPVLGNSTDNLIIAKALTAYYIHKIPFEEYVSNPDKYGNHIYDYCKSNKIGRQFQVMWNNKPQQRLNRYYFSKHKPFLMKVKVGKEYSDLEKDSLRDGFKKLYPDNTYEEIEDRLTAYIFNTPPQHVNVGEGVVLFNNFEEKSFNSYDVNYNYYIKQIRDIVDTINNYNQLTLF